MLPLRLVIDTNVLISAAVKPARLQRTVLLLAITKPARLDTTGPQTYARNYLEKPIQVPFRIPALGETETRIYVTLLLIGAQLPEDDADFTNLIAAAREQKTVLRPSNR